MRAILRHRKPIGYQGRPAAARPTGDVDAVLVQQLEQLAMFDPALFGWNCNWTYRFEMLDPSG